MKILIIGKGIAGSLTAYEALKRGHDITLITGNDHSYASQVAAGVCTPITGKRFALSWEYSRFYHEALQTYQQFSAMFNTKLFHPLDVLRVFRSQEELEAWNNKKNWPEFNLFIKNQYAANHFKNIINDIYGSLLLTNCGWCDVPLLLKHLHIYLQNNTYWLEVALDINDLHIEPASVRWKDEFFDAVIFCQGYRTLQNPYFNWFPFQLSKGEVLQLDRPTSVPSDKILNFGVWFVPQENGKAISGSTHEWIELNEIATEKGRDEIMGGLTRHLKIPLEVTGQQAGVRCAVYDMLPICGAHPEHPNLWILNGLGAKGILRTPYLAKYLIDRLENKQDCWQEVDPKRYWK